MFYMFTHSTVCPGRPLLLKHAFNERPANLKLYPLPCFDQLLKTHPFTKFSQDNLDTHYRALLYFVQWEVHERMRGNLLTSSL